MVQFELGRPLDDLLDLDLRDSNPLTLEPSGNNFVIGAFNFANNTRHASVTTATDPGTIRTTPSSTALPRTWRSSAMAAAFRAKTRVPLISLIVGDDPDLAGGSASRRGTAAQADGASRGLLAGRLFGPDVNVNRNRVGVFGGEAPWPDQRAVFLRTPRRCHSASHDIWAKVAIPSSRMTAPSDDPSSRAAMRPYQSGARCAANLIAPKH